MGHSCEINMIPIIILNKTQSFITGFITSQEWPMRADKVSLLTASGMLLHAFPSLFVSSLRTTVLTNTAAPAILNPLS
jgi:hypothetical protein